MQATIREIGIRAKAACHKLANLSSAQRSGILNAMADGLEQQVKFILEENQKDLQHASANGYSSPNIERLTLTEARLSDIISSVRHVSSLKDPIGAVISEDIRPNGLLIKKIKVPIGVIAIVYESRPNVTVDSAALCIRTGNAVILRGGSESLNSNLALEKALLSRATEAGLPEGSLQVIANSGKTEVRELVQLEGLVDLVIPRGGEGLIRAVTESARVPVIKHYKGVCHIYVDESAPFEQAVRIIENAKCQRPGVCNAVETILIHRSISVEFLKVLSSCLLRQGVQFRADAEVREIMPGIASDIQPRWDEEYLDLILGVKIVSNVEEAVAHINTHGSKHSDSILSETPGVVNYFLTHVDSAVVYHNASTRFTDGNEFGFGAEIGISTDKLHARGPMGPEELCSYKYLVYGQGHTR